MIVIVEDLTYDDVTGDIPGPANIPTHLMVKENYTTEKETESLQYERV